MRRCARNPARNKMEFKEESSQEKNAVGKETKSRTKISVSDEKAEEQEEQDTAILIRRKANNSGIVRSLSRLLFP